jgi:hypothetical protein
VIGANVVITANGSNGTSGQVLTSNGTGLYWSTSAGVNTAAQYNWTNTQTFSSNIVLQSNTDSANAVFIQKAVNSTSNGHLNARMGETRYYNEINITASNGNYGYNSILTGAGASPTAQYDGYVSNSAGYVSNYFIYSLINSTHLEMRSYRPIVGGNYNRIFVETNDTQSYVNVTSGNNTTITGSGILISNNTSANLLLANTSVLTTINLTDIRLGNSTTNVIISNTTSTFGGNLSATNIAITNKLNIGTAAGFDFGSLAVVEIDASQNTYVQSVIQNANAGTNASSDLVITNDTGNDVFNYIDLGINSSTYSNATYSIGGASDAYLYASNGALAIGTASAKELVFHANGTTSTDRKFTINATSIVVANSVAFVANGSNGTSGQVLASNGTGLYWSTVSGVNTADQYTWTNTQFFQANLHTGNTAVNTQISNNTILISNATTTTSIGLTDIRLGNTTTNVVISNTTSTFGGNLSSNNIAITNKLNIGTAAGFDFGVLAEIEIDASQNTYAQIVIQNANSGTNASGDLIVTNDTGNDTVNFVDLGINSSTYNNTQFSVSGAGDAYLYASNGAFSIGTASAKNLIFHSGGTTSNDVVMTINATAIIVDNAAGIVANGSIGSAGQFLASDGAGVYWADSAQSLGVIVALYNNLTMA